MKSPSGGWLAMRWLVAVVLLLPGCIVLEPASPTGPEPLDPELLARLRSGPLPWDPHACDPTQAATAGSNTWRPERAAMLAEDGRYLAFVLGDPVTGESQLVTMNGGDTPIWGERVTRWRTENGGQLLVRDGRALYLPGDENATPAIAQALAAAAVDGLGLDVGAWTGNGSLGILVTAPGADPKAPFGWLRVQLQHRIIEWGRDYTSHRGLELDLRPWPTADAQWLTAGDARTIARSFLRCQQDRGELPTLLERPDPTSAWSAFADGQLVWEVRQVLDWEFGRRSQCSDEATWPWGVRVVVDARTGAVLRSSAYADGVAVGCIIEY